MQVLLTTEAQKYSRIRLKRCFMSDLRRILRCAFVVGLRHVFSWRKVARIGVSVIPRHCSTVVPALGDPRRERPPAVYGHFVNVPTHFNVKLNVISGHLPNADSHLLVACTCYNGQCKQMPRFRWSFQPNIACAHLNLRPSVLSIFRAVVWLLTSNIRDMPRHRE